MACSETNWTSATISFSYDALPDARYWIRLIEILPGADSAETNCSITAYKLEEAPAYFAVSYTWGDPADMVSILMDGKRLQIRNNCRQVLQQARYHASSRYYWIDAICINQADLDEKNHQVQFMSQIFESAAHVHACIGQHADDSEFVFSILDTFPRRLRQRSKEEWPRVRSGAQVIMWLLSHSKEDIERLSRGFASILSRPYFQRVWILQEVFRKQSRTSICCGKDRQPLHVYLRLANAFHWMPPNPDGGWYPIEKFKTFANMAANHKFSAVDYRYSYYDYPSAAASFVLSVSFPGRRFSNRASGRTTKDGEDGLEEVIGMLNAFQCHDPRDRIYGTLPLVDWASQVPISPDYRKSRFDLALEVLLCGWDRRQFTSITRLLELATAFSLDIGDQETVESIHAYCQRAIELTKSTGSTRIAAGSKRTLLALWRKVARTDTVPDQNLCKYESESLKTMHLDALTNNGLTVPVLGWKATNSGLSNEVWVGFPADVRIVLVIRPDSYGDLTMFELSTALEAQKKHTYRTGLFDVVLDPEDALVLASVLASNRSSEKVPQLLQLIWETFRPSESPSMVEEAMLRRRGHLLRSSGTAKAFEWSKARPLAEQEMPGQPRLVMRWVWPGKITLQRIRYRINTWKAERVNKQHNARGGRVEDVEKSTR